MRIVKITLLALLGLIVIVIAAAAFLLTTNPGLNFLVGQAKGYLPQLTAGTFNGSVLRLDAREVEWQQPGVRFKGDFGWHLDFGELLSGQVVFDDFYLQKSLVTVDSAQMAQATPAVDEPQQPEQEPSEGINLQAPIPVHIHSIRLADVVVDLDEMALEVKKFDTAFHWTAEGIDVPSLDLKGFWQAYPLSMQGAVNTRQSGKLVHLSDIALMLGDNQVNVDGDVRLHAAVPNLDLGIRLNAKDFSQLVSTLQGSAHGRLGLQGPVLMPLINADLTLRSLATAGVSVDQVTLSGAMSAEKNATGGAKLSVNGISLPGFFIDRFNAVLDGSQKSHELKMAMQSEPVQMKAVMGGALNDSFDAWQGALKSLNIQTQYGPVSMEQPMPMAFDTKTLLLQVGHFCLAHPNAKMCLSNDLNVDLLQKKALDVKLALEKFDLGFFKRYMPGQFEATGVLHADAELKVPEGFEGLPTGQFTLSGKNLNTRYMLEQSDFLLGFDAVNVGLSHDGKKFNAGWKIQLTKNGKLSGDVSILDPMKTRALEGNAKIENLSAALVDSLLAPGENAQGMVYGDLRLGGTLTEPLLYGSTGIRNLRIDSTKMPFEMQPSNFELAFNGNKSTLAGELKTPKGGLTLKGDADWKTLAEGHTRIAAKGVKMRVTMPPSVELDLTTDVQCEASAEKISLRGLIDLPWARVKVYDLPPSAVDVSDDVVRLDRPRPKKDDQSDPIPIDSNLFINIGDDVRVDAMGLKARLTGKLHVVQNNGKLGLTGQVNVPRGQFKAYGQDLIVRHGEFMFAGSADNPLINLEAIRNPEKTADDVVAGIRVTGQADMPEVTIFTEPEKNQTESLSYLMRGEGLDPAGEDDNTMITSALINLGLSQGSRAIESLGDAVGISGLGVDTEGVGDSSKVAVSGYILPGLKVKYAVGLFDSLATLTLRYRVIPRLYVEAASGVDQALDVLYSFEF